MGLIADDILAFDPIPKLNGRFLGGFDVDILVPADKRLVRNVIPDPKRRIPTEAKALTPVQKNQSDGDRGGALLPGRTHLPAGYPAIRIGSLNGVHLHLGGRSVRRVVQGCVNFDTVQDILLRPVTPGRGGDGMLHGRQVVTD